MSGITEQGFVGKGAVESKADFDDAFKGIYGESLGSEADGSIPAATSIGQEISILTDSESSAWEVLGAIYAAFDVDQADEPQIDILCALTGTRRDAAASSVVTETCHGVIGTLLEVDRVVKVVGTLARFVSREEATLAAVATAWAGTTPYALNDLRTNDGSIWQCVVPGTSAGAGGPTGTGLQVDGGVTWRYVTADTKGVALVLYASEDTGPIGASSMQLTSIATPISGWEGAFNALAADVGRNRETTPALRAKRVLELQSAGGGPADAIRAAMLEIDGVISCAVFVNTGDVVDADGVPAHGVEVLVQTTAALTDQDVAEYVWDAVGAGTATGGGISKTVQDDSGNPQTVKFSRPTEVPIFVQATVYYDPAQWPVAGVVDAVTAAAQSALLTAAASYYQVGYDVRVLTLAAAIKDGPQATELVAGLPSPVVPAPEGSAAAPGITDVDLQTHRDADPFAYTAIVIGKRELATFDVGDVTITPSSLVP